ADSVHLQTTRYQGYKSPWKQGEDRPAESHRAAPTGVGPDSSDDVLLSAIASALHMSSAPITGQTSVAAEKNPAIWLNTSQPLCKAFTVTDEQIRWTEHTAALPVVLHSVSTLNITGAGAEGVPGPEEPSGGADGRQFSEGSRKHPGAAPRKDGLKTN
ncbi:hypothetical protein XENOCAPTIV_020133, partial [Xenoophorus captivus]